MDPPESELINNSETVIKGLYPLLERKLKFILTGSAEMSLSASDTADFGARCGQISNEQRH